ncbi:helix-turn-helix domain-containing protein [Pseudomonas sp. PDM25]|uniref:helix-turn-helix domain-containing protein n=1 Tax=Pseudomonas sp. PDM25 TaxID=2854772 RepID=UPI0035C74FE7
MHLWSTYAQYLLAGWPTQGIAKAMGISPSTTWRWIKPCRAVMAKEFPALYRWWSARQDRASLEPPPHCRPSPGVSQWARAIVDDSTGSVREVWFA